jgi:type IV pilus assembly protein PilY1
MSATRPSRRSRFAAPAFAFCATLLSLPGAAVTIPDVPLQSGAAYPPANVMFILDDSGSMEWDFMPGASDSSEVPAVSPVNIALNAYPRNTLYYNPTITYNPWIKADNSRYNTGTAYTSAWSHDSLLSNAVNLGAGTRTFYAPKPGATDMAATASYYRYQILPSGTDIVRSEYGTVTSSWTTAPNLPGALSASNGNMRQVYNFVLPANVDTLEITLEGDNPQGRGADLYVRRGAEPTTGAYHCESNGGSNDEDCTFDNPTAGTWYVGVNRDSNYSNVVLQVRWSSNNRCGSGGGSVDWTNCTSATPQFTDANGATISRSVADELVNYATWYSYHRTRIKVAKAGASEAFARLGTGIRVGYDSIWNRNPYLIPVGTGNGTFTGGNRTDWFDHLHAANGNSGTPLKGALQRAGEYFSNTAATGPWGPETGAAQLSCRQNFAILTTDGYWNDNSGYDTPVGDADGTAGPTHTEGDDTYTYTLAKPYIDNFSGANSTRGNTLADVAMHYWKRDLVTALTNNVPDTTADPAFWQHMVTFGVSIGLQGRLDPKSDLPLITLGSKRWGDPTDAEDADRIDDLWHASVNGHGNFVSAKNPTEFAQALADALQTVASRLGSASNVISNTATFSAGTRIYQATYTSGSWIGELSAYDATAAGVSATAAWKASAKLPTTANRRIFTWGGTSGTTFPTSAQVSSLARTGGIAPVAGLDNANYIKGDTSLERRNGKTLRSRETRLGDIVNSSPAYVADTQTIYVGANDGMLHAFDARPGASAPAGQGDGVELFAYVPGGVDMAQLATLSDPQYVHRYFVDGPVVVSTRKQTPGKNYLVGALGRGGKGVFGLDVSTPTSFVASQALWEIGDGGGDMGMVLGEPLVVTLNDATATKAVLVPNGINSTNGHAVLFVVNLATGAILRKIDTGVAGDNGLSAPRGRDIDGNGTVDVVYAGDLKGNLWKFDMSGATPTSWVTAFGGQPLFTARNGQAITAGLAIARNPADNRPWIFFGTGRFLSSSDISDTTTQSLYGIIDDGVRVTATDLQAREIAAVVRDAKGVVKQRAFEAAAPLPVGKKGWFIDLDEPTPGERITSRALIDGARLVVTSIIPPTSSACDAGGQGFINALDAFSGTSFGSPYIDVNGDGLFDDRDRVGGTGGGLVLGSYNPGGGLLTGVTIIEGTNGSSTAFAGTNSDDVVSAGLKNMGGFMRRVMWHEILQD